MFGTMGISELIIILVIVLIIFGAGKLPQIGEGVGKALRGFKKEVNDIPPPDAAPPEANQLAPTQVQSTIQACTGTDDDAGTDSRRSEAHGTLYAWAGTDSRDHCRLDAQHGYSATAGSANDINCSSVGLGPIDGAGPAASHDGRTRGCSHADDAGAVPASSSGRPGKTSS